jgi:hypothetical protein
MKNQNTETPVEITDEQQKDFAQIRTKVLFAGDNVNYWQSMETYWRQKEIEMVEQFLENNSHPEMEKALEELKSQNK